jgi:hypothetical protein
MTLEEKSFRALITSQFLEKICTRISGWARCLRGLILVTGANERAEVIECA